MTTETLTSPTDYELKIDEQVEKFVEIKQKLTYFLITASVAVTAYVVDFIIDNRSGAQPYIWLTIISALAGLLTSGFSLLNLHLELRSYNLHIRYRYQKRSWESLNGQQKSSWEKLNRYAAFLLKCAFISLFAEIGSAIVFFILFFQK